MKKLLAIMLALALPVSIAACGNDDDNDSESNDKTEISDRDNKKGNSDKKTINTMIIDEDDLTVELTDLSYDKDSNLVIGVKINNSSDDTTYVISKEHAYINGIELSASLLKKVTPGKEVSDEITIYSGEYKKYGLFDNSRISLEINARDDDSYEAEYYGTADLYPYGEEKASDFERNEDALGNVLFDTDYARAYLLDFEDDTMYIYLENLISNEITVIMNYLTINGKSQENGCYFGGDIQENKGAISVIQNVDIDEDEIETIKFTLSVEDNEEYDTLVKEKMEYSAE